MTDFMPARMKDGTLYAGNKQFLGNGIAKSCGKCGSHQPPAGFRKTRYGMTCARCVQQMEKK